MSFALLFRLRRLSITWLVLEVVNLDRGRESNLFKHVRMVSLDVIQRSGSLTIQQPHMQHPRSWILVRNQQL